jgi:hypothetical protein
MTREQSADGDREKREAAGELPKKTHEVAEQVKEVALDRMDSVRQSTQSAKQNAAERVRKLGQTVRKVGEHLRVEDQHYIAQKASDASQRLEDFASYVSEAEIGALIRDTGDLARKSPVVFFGSAFAIGLAAGRFLRTGTGDMQQSVRRSSGSQLGQSALAPTSSPSRPGSAVTPRKPAPSARPGQPTRGGAGV